MAGCRTGRVSPTSRMFATGEGWLIRTGESQYASHKYRHLAAAFGIMMSMSRKGNAWDNAAMESFFRTLKVDRIYQVRYGNRAQARLDIVDWIEGFYNRVRMHTAVAVDGLYEGDR
jgi:putative transposase